jgi:hypothetical protein
MIEYYTRRRLHILGILGAGFVCSFSGTGILAITAGFLLPRSISRIPVFFAAAFGLAVILFILYSAEIPGLAIWFDRLSEFTTPNTSAFARFVAPIEMIKHSFDNGTAATWLGNGGGSYLRETTLLHLKSEISDPTWAKLTYEYGLFGFALISLVFARRLFSSSLPIQICNYFLFAWMSIGVVLKPSFALLVWVLTLVPQAYRRPNPEKMIRPKRTVASATIPT